VRPRTFWSPLVVLAVETTGWHTLVVLGPVKPDASQYWTTDPRHNQSQTNASCILCLTLYTTYSTIHQWQSFLYQTVFTPMRCYALVWCLLSKAICLSVHLFCHNPVLLKQLHLLLKLFHQMPSFLWLIGITKLGWNNPYWVQKRRWLWWDIEIWAFK